MAYVYRGIEDSVTHSVNLSFCRIHPIAQPYRPYSIRLTTLHGVADFTMLTFPCISVPSCRCGMPKGPGHFSERAGWNSSKNAKDKSNNAAARRGTLGDRGHRGQAGPGALGGLGERLSHFDSGKDSEKDSGYSGETGTPAQWGYFFILLLPLPHAHLHTCKLIN